MASNRSSDHRPAPGATGGDPARAGPHTRPSSVWPTQAPPVDSALEPELISHFDPQPGRAQQLRAMRAERLVLCQPALALRLLLAVMGAAEVATLPAADGGRDWLLRAPVVGCATLAGTLLWLSAVCALREGLPRWRPQVASAVVLSLGAVSALAGWLLCLALGVALPGWWQPLAVAVCGGVLAALLWAWLALRAAAHRPLAVSARLAELQSRIRPHFLFNALNTALALVQVDPPRAESVLEDLSQLFRAALAETAPAVSLDDEVQLARRYLAIEQIRFGHRLQLVWDLDAAAGIARLPPLVLQPLVENAVRHGVEPVPAGGTVRIRSHVARGMAVVEVVNDLPPEPGPPGSGLALANVRERLRLLHDLAGRLHTETRHGRFIARIEVPL